MFKMKKILISKKLSRTAASALETLLKAEANSTSCVVLNQPKAPEQLARFKKVK